MKFIYRWLPVIFFCQTLIFSLKTSAEIRLPQLISNGMILQRNHKINVWGWAAPGEKVTVNFKAKNYKAVTSENGSWKIILDPQKAGGPFTMQIRGNNSIQIEDILIGDVWFCSGQSNMALSMERVKEKYPEEIKNANFPQIRNFFVPTLADVTRIHADLPPGKWMITLPENVLSFGAATYFFAKKLYAKYHVPIGIINSSVGGTPVQAWISANGLKNMPQYAGRIAQFSDTSFTRQILVPVQSNGNNPSPKQTDLGLTEKPNWFDPAYSPENWHHFFLPGYWTDQGIRNLNGVVWFRKEFEVPANMAGKPAKLFMGRIVDADETYLNGVKVGNITYQYPPRRYTVPANLLKPGKNTIVVRVTNTGGKGGFVPDKPYHLTDGTTDIDLRGDWQYKVGQVFTPADTKLAPAFSAQNEPTGLYNTMVSPAQNYTVKGFLWYQGEANTDKPLEYGDLLKALITDWRANWKQGDLPFIYAQLPNFMEVQYSPAESNWAALRQQQLQTLSVAKTGMAVTIDLGEWNDIHPLNKKDVGERLALSAENLAYQDQNVIASGPIVQSAKMVGTQILVSFKDSGSRLMIKDGNELKQFALAGANGKFTWANARIEGNTVLVDCSRVAEPKTLRYAWADNPEGANLYNKAGLPAAPFQINVSK